MKVSLLDVFSRYLQSQAALPEKARQPQPLAITISREVGAGGITIAELVGQRLTAVKDASREPLGRF